MATARIQVGITATLDEIATGLTKQFNATLTGEDYDQGKQLIGTSAELLVLKAELATIGWAIFYNADATNYVRLGDWNGGTPQVYFARVPPQTAILVYCELAWNNIAAIADTANCELHFIAYER